MRSTKPLSRLISATESCSRLGLHVRCGKVLEIDILADPARLRQLKEQRAIEFDLGHPRDRCEPPARRGPEGSGPPKGGRHERGGSTGSASLMPGYVRLARESRYRPSRRIINGRRGSDCFPMSAPCPA